MKFLSSVALAFLFLSFASVEGKEYIIVNPNTAGSVADVSARVLAESYKKRTGNTLTVQNIGGGSQIPGVVHFKQLGRPGIMINTTGTLVFNQKMMNDLPYSDSDFNHVSAISLAPAVWVVRGDSPYNSMKHLVDTLPASQKPFVAYANAFELANFLMVSKKYQWSKDKVVAVKYKGPSEVVLGLLTGDTDVAMVALLPSIVEQVKNGKLKILGSSSNKDITVNNLRISPVEKLIQVEQFSGGSFLSLSTNFDVHEANQLKLDLIESLKDPMVIDSLKSRNQYLIEVGEQPMIEFIDNYRKKIAPLELNSTPK
jgi:tripartite-type tricarboxylate transporter receptor subunit TctC